MLLTGRMQDVLKFYPDNYFDSVVTDPPYGLKFMGKKWDYSVTTASMWAECLRVLKPGGHLLSFSGSRTYHRMTVNIEDAGFEIRDMIAWVYGSGFPKSLDIGKAIDKNNGKHKVDLRTFGDYVKTCREKLGLSRKQLDDLMGTNTAVSWWEGRKTGVQLPSLETYNKLKLLLGLDNRFDELIQWSEAEREVTGQINDTTIDINPGNSKTLQVLRDITAPKTPEAIKWDGWGTALKPALEPITVARKPLSEGTVAANVLKWGVGGINIDACRVGMEEVTKTQSNGIMISPHGTKIGRYPSNLMHDGCIDKPYFYHAKTSKTDRHRGCEDLRWTKVSEDEYIEDPNGEIKGNFHPTVKPTALMSYLVKLVTPEGGEILDPFKGSGSTGVGAKEAGDFKFTGIDLHKHNTTIAARRIKC